MKQAHLTMGEAVLVDIGPASERRWGYYQFPSIWRLPDGAIAVAYQLADDSITSYGRCGRGIFFSTDEGKTWQRYAARDARKQEEDSLASGLLLPNGDRIRISDAVARPISELDLPRPIATCFTSYDGVRGPSPCYRLHELPPEWRGFRLDRLARGQTKWTTELGYIDDPQDVRFPVQDLLHITFFGRLRVAPDGSILAGVYPHNYIREDGSIDFKCASVFYRSTDDGRTWKVQGRIPYQPDRKIDPVGELRGGFTEPDYEILADGSLYCVLRTTDGTGIGPLYASRSSDLGKTWTKPEVIAPNGVLPQLLRLANGALVLVSGRPGVQVRVSPDGRGETWTPPCDLVPVTSNNEAADSCGYAGLLATGPDRCLVAYSHFRHRDEQGQEHKAILVREIRVEIVEKAEETGRSPMPETVSLARVEKHYYDREGGRISQEIPFVAGKVHGVVRTYYLEGTIACETPFVRGVVQGVQKWYYRNGRLKSELTWAADQKGVEHLHGVHREYNEHGFVTLDEYYWWWAPCTKAEWEARSKG